MHIVIQTSIVILFICLILGMWRIHRGPDAIDRILVAQLLGTSCVAILVLNTALSPIHTSIDAALVFALLSAIAAIAFLQTHTDHRRDTDDTE